LGRDFPHLSRPALGPTRPPVQWVPGFSPVGKERPVREADPSPLLVPWLRKSRAISLLRLWAVRPVQNLTTCTRVPFIFFKYNSFPCAYVTFMFTETRDTTCRPSVTRQIKWQ